MYEGTDLEALIQRVVDEHGPARIRPPERRRTGGVFGFFAREVYVISVDPEATDRAGHDRATGNGRLRGRTATAAAAPAGGHTPIRPAPGPGPLTAPGSLADLIDATEDDLDLGSSGRAANRPRQPSAPAAGRAGGSAPPRTVKPFSQVLSEVASSLGEEPGTYRVDPERLRRITPLVPPPAKPRRAPSAPLTAMVEHPAGTGPVPASAVASMPSPLAEPAAAPVRAPRAPARISAPPPAVPVSAPPAPARVAAPPPPPPARVAAPPPPAPPSAARPGTPPDAPRRRSSSGQPGLGAAVVDLLLAAGFPEGLLPPPSEGRAALTTLEQAFARLPQVPALPTAAGGLVAVVGDARLVRPLVRSVAAQVGCPPDEVAVAAPSAGAGHATPGYRVRTPEQAATLARGWRRDRVGVVAVYAPPLGAAQDWTRQVLRAMRPSCVWGTATATTKPDDVRRWIAAIGGADALAVAGATATATPAAILSTGVPVARLDDEVATPERWAAVLADLLTRG